MSKIEDLIKQYCPNGVEWKHLYEVTVWDKRFNSVERYKQPTVIDYKKYFLGEEQKQLVSDGGSVKILTTYASNLYADEKSVADYITDGEIVCIPWGGNAIVQYYKGKFVTGDNRIATSLDVNVLSNKYLYYMMQCNLHLIASFYRGSGIKHPDMSKVLDILIPVPPRPVQDEIVRILDKFTELEKELEKELELRRKQYEFYRDKLLTFGDDVEYKKLGDVGCVRMCKRIMKDQTSSTGDVPFYKIGTFGGTANAYITQELFDEYSSRYNYPKKGNVLISAAGTIGRTVVFNDKPSYFQDSNIVWLEHDGTQVTDEYLKYIYSTSPWYVADGGTISRLYNDNILNAIIPVPSITEQERIVKILDKFDTLTTSLTSGLPAEIKLRKQQYEYYRDYLFGLLN